MNLKFGVGGAVQSPSSTAPFPASFHRASPNHPPFSIKPTVQRTLNRMPPSRKQSKKNQRNDGWVTGGMRGIRHEAFIARGGYGEVHKVRVPSIDLTDVKDVGRKEWTCTAKNCA